MNVLTVTYHDPDGKLFELMETAVPILATLFDGMVVNASEFAFEPTLSVWKAHGAIIKRRPAGSDKGFAQLGQYRREAVQFALETGADFIMFNDGDRVAHWAMNYPDELKQTIQTIIQYDFTVLGRTERAFAAHPRVQTDTEELVNRQFGVVSGLPWDVTAAARGLSRRAATAIVDGNREDSVGVDAAWPLFLQAQGGYTLGYVETEGLEFETADQATADIAAAGSESAWKTQLDADPRRWIFRLNAARVEIEAMLSYI
ncbi:MAG: hypothetical protein GY943_38020 [Chloroflexi bacterium]|nr:hypothetical protein [Chloroflexota bacterium]